MATSADKVTAHISQNCKYVEINGFVACQNIVAAQSRIMRSFFGDVKHEKT